MEGRTDTRHRGRGRRSESPGPGRSQPPRTRSGPEGSCPPSPGGRAPPPAAPPRPPSVPCEAPPSCPPPAVTLFPQGPRRPGRPAPRSALPAWARSRPRRPQRIPPITTSRCAAPHGVLTPRPARRHVAQRQLRGAVFPAEQPDGGGAAPHRVALVRGLLLPGGPGVQPAGAGRAGGRQAGRLARALLLPHAPLRPGPHRLHGAAGDRRHRGGPARRAARLARRRPRLPPVPVHGRRHGLLRPLPAAAGRRHGLGAPPGHHAALLAARGLLAPPGLGHRGAGVGRGAGAGPAAAAGRGPLHRAVPRLLVLPDARRPARGRGLRPPLHAPRQPLGGAVLPAQHHQRGHPVPRVPRAGGGPAAPAGLRGGDDGPAHGHHGGGQHLLDAAAGLHRPDGAAQPARHEPDRTAVPGHRAAAAHLPARGHLEPDPGPLGVHPVPPGGDPSPAPSPQRAAQVAVPAAPAHPEAPGAVGPQRDGRTRGAPQPARSPGSPESQKGQDCACQDGGAPPAALGTHHQLLSDPFPLPTQKGWAGMLGGGCLRKSDLEAAPSRNPLRMGGL